LSPDPKAPRKSTRTTKTTLLRESGGSGGHLRSVRVEFSQRLRSQRRRRKRFRAATGLIDEFGEAVPCHTPLVVDQQQRRCDIEEVPLCQVVLPERRDVPTVREAGYDLLEL
jgi:hypothetical protein